MSSGTVLLIGRLTDLGYARAVRLVALIVSLGCGSAALVEPPTETGGEEATVEAAEPSQLSEAPEPVRPAVCTERHESEGSMPTVIVHTFDEQGRLVRETIQVRGRESTSDYVHESGGAYTHRGPVVVQRFQPSEEGNVVTYAISELIDGAEPFELGQRVFTFRPDGTIASVGESSPEVSLHTSCTYDDEGRLVRRQSGEGGWDVDDVRFGWSNGRLSTIEMWEPDPDRPHMPGSDEDTTFVPKARAVVTRDATVTTARFAAFDATDGSFTGPLVTTVTITAGCESMFFGDCAHPLRPRVP